MRCALLWFLCAMLCLPGSAAANVTASRGMRVMITFSAYLKAYAIQHDEVLASDLETLLQGLDPNLVREDELENIRRDVLYVPQTPLQISAENGSIIAVLKHGTKFSTGIRRFVLCITRTGEMNVESFPDEAVRKAALDAGVTLPSGKVERIGPFIDQYTANTIMEIGRYAVALLAVLVVLRGLYILRRVFKKSAAKP